MAVINSAQSGNFTDTATWVGGVVPTTGDTATVLTGHVVTIDSSVTCDEVTNANNTGYFDLVNGGTLNANVTGGATTANNGVVRASMTTSATINGNITVTSTTSSTMGVVITGTGTLTVNGDCGFSGSAASRRAIRSETANSKLTLVGDATASANTQCVAVEFTSSATGAVVDITGNITGAGGTNGANGVSVTGANSTVVFSGTATAGSSSNRHGLVASAQGMVITASGTFVGGSSDGFGADLNCGSGGSITVNNAVLTNTSGTSGALRVQAAGTSPVSVDIDALSLGTGSSSGRGLRFSSGTGTNTIDAVNGLLAGTGTGASGTEAVLIDAGTVTINADITGRGSAGLVVAGGNVTVNGDVFGNATAGIGVNPGVSITSRTVRVTLNGDANGGQYGPGVEGSGMLLLNGASTAHVQGYVGCAVARTFIDDPSTWSDQAVEYNGLDVFNEPNNGTIITVVDNTTGYPVAADVRSGTSYAAGTLTGTLAVPPTDSVASGVPVDNTVGTAAVKLADVATVVGAQIAGALDT